MHDADYRQNREHLGAESLARGLEHEAASLARSSGHSRGHSWAQSAIALSRGLCPACSGTGRPTPVGATEPADASCELCDGGGSFPPVVSISRRARHSREMSR